MRSFLEPGPALRPFLFALRFYLCLFMVGCAAHRPPVSEIRSMETRLMLGDDRDVFKACVGALQDLGYTVDVSDREGGVLTASRTTHEQSGVITQEPRDPDHEGMPTWAKVALIATGVILIVGLVAILTNHDDDNDKAKDSNADHAKVKRQDLDRHHRHHHHDEEREEPPVIVVGEPASPTTYEYHLTLNLHRRGRDATQVRASLQGTEWQGKQVNRSGPVDDPRFFERFFVTLDDALEQEQREQGR